MPLKSTKLKNETEFQRELQRSLTLNFGKKQSFWKNHGSQYSVKGCFDLTGHISGILVAIEAKMWSGRPSTDQKAFAKRLALSGAFGVYAIYRWEDGEHRTYFVPSSLPFSYRMTTLWQRAGVKTFVVNGREEHGLDLSNLAYLLTSYVDGVKDSNQFLTIK